MEKPHCAQQTTTLETMGDVESRGLIRDADGDLHKSLELVPLISVDMAMNKPELTTPWSSEFRLSLLKYGTGWI